MAICIHLTFLKNEYKIFTTIILHFDTIDSFFGMRFILKQKNLIFFVLLVVTSAMMIVMASLHSVHF